MSADVLLRRAYKVPATLTAMPTAKATMVPRFAGHGEFKHLSPSVPACC